MRSLIQPISLLLLSGAANAADPAFFITAESTAGQSYSPVISVGYIVQLIFSLAVVVGFLYVTAKYLLPKMQTGTKSKQIEITDKLVIEPQVSSYVIKAGGNSYFIIVNSKTTTLIDKLPINDQV
jgi:flagellar biogenesis protein FliO